MMDEQNSRLHASVRGRVQGVSFRYFVVEQAQTLKLNGWVRNRWEGSVELLAEGTHQNLEILLEALRDGPPMARVAEVDFDWQPFTGEFTSFRVRSTG